MCCAVNGWFCNDPATLDCELVAFLGLCGVCVDAEFLDSCPQLACRELWRSLGNTFHDAACSSHGEVAGVSVDRLCTPHINDT
jgi:hypothetical protein